MQSNLPEGFQEAFDKRRELCADQPHILDMASIDELLLIAGADPIPDVSKRAMEIISSTDDREKAACLFVEFVDQCVADMSRKLLRELFDSLDENQDGVLQFNEVKNGFASLGVQLTDEELHELFTQADGNGDEVLQFEEFVTAVGRFQQ